MDKFKVGELEAMIPSKTVRDFVLETGRTFTDWEKAALLSDNWLLPWKSECSWLRSLRDETTDDVLHEQISAYLNRQEQVFAEFHNNEERKYIYVVKIRDPDYVTSGIDPERIKYVPYGDLNVETSFMDAKLAIEYGLNVGFEFSVYKYKISTAQTVHDLKCADAGEDESHLSEKDCVRGEASYEAGSMNFNENGELMYVNITAIPSDIDEDETKNFQGRFYHAPNPFTRGDLVRVVNDTDFRVVELPQKNWIERVKRNREYDVAKIGTATLVENGDFMFGHVEPTHLERYEPYKDPENKVIDDLLMQVSALYQGKGSFIDFQHCQEAYRKEYGYEN